MVFTGFRSGSFATVWSTEPGQGKYTKVRLSISRKNKETGEYEDEFSGFCMFIGEARVKAEGLKERDRIKLGDVDVSRRYDKEKNKEYFNFKVFSFEMAEDQAQQNQSRPQSNAVEGNNIEGVETDELPFDRPGERR